MIHFVMVFPFPSTLKSADYLPALVATATVATLATLRGL
jgi:hypothetical protein